MADFEAILKKALASRGEPSGEERRKIYDRARTALMNQLKSLEPPLAPEEISQQRLALEAAIRKVEAAAAGASMPAPTAPQPKPQPAPIEKPVQPGVAPRTANPAAITTKPIEVADEAQERGKPRLPNVDEAPGITLGEASAAKAADAPEKVAFKVANEAAPAPERAKTTQTPQEKPAARQAAGAEKTPPRWGLLIVVLSLVVILGGLAYGYQSGAFDTLMASREQPDGQTQTENQPTPTPAPNAEPDKVEDRLLPDGGGVERAQRPVEPAQTPAQTPAPPATPAQTPPADAPQTGAAAVSVGQAAILYEEGSGTNDQGFRVTGNAIWRSEGAGEAMVIIGEVTIPNRGLSLTMRISKNSDATLPASHLIEYQFTTSPDFTGNGILSVVGLIAKEQEQSRGDALRGAIAEIGGGLFWHALSNEPADIAANIPALRSRQWFDIPILYGDRRRAILTFEKGEPGEAVFTRALAAWGE